VGERGCEKEKRRPVLSGLFQPDDSHWGIRNKKEKKGGTDERKGKKADVPGT